MSELPNGMERARSIIGECPACQQFYREADDCPRTHCPHCNVNLEDYDEPKRCVYCDEETSATVHGEPTCSDCLSDEPDSSGEPPETLREQYVAAHALSRELHR